MDPAPRPPTTASGDADGRAGAFVREALRQVAPERDLASLDPDAELTEALDIDSIGFIRFVDTLAERAGVVIAVRDYPDLLTFARSRAYVARRLADSPPG